ncbi:hypothetical protein DL771_010155 [Monosporascus sp. 5C6A]|nr:hypothetical protein DL771_010155 [Monosporascus sp. 5C6A]
MQPQVPGLNEPLSSQAPVTRRRDLSKFVLRGELGSSQLPLPMSIPGESDARSDSSEEVEYSDSVGSSGCVSAPSGIGTMAELVHMCTAFPQSSPSRQPPFTETTFLLWCPPVSSARR